MHGIAPFLSTQVEYSTSTILYELWQYFKDPSENETTIVIGNNYAIMGKLKYNEYETYNYDPGDWSALRVRSLLSNT